MKVWITKYCLTDGIQACEANINRVFDTIVSVDVPGGVNGHVNYHKPFYHKPFWHTTEAEAVAHAEKIRDRKIASLKKAINKLEKMEF
jgi:hypothetical protein